MHVGTCIYLYTAPRSSRPLSIIASGFLKQAPAIIKRAVVSINTAATTPSSHFTLPFFFTMSINSGKTSTMRICIHTCSRVQAARLANLLHVSSRSRWSRDVNVQKCPRIETWEYTLNMADTLANDSPRSDLGTLALYPPRHSHPLVLGQQR